MNTYTFYDIFDTDSLQKLMDSLSTALHVGVRIRGPQGEIFTNDSDYCHFCKEIIKKSPVGSIRCEQSVLALCSYKDPSPHISYCNSAGLTDAGINIMVDGVHMASLIVGQVRLAENEHTEKEYREIARSLQLDEEEYLKYIQDIPPMSREQFDNILNALTLLAEHLSQLGRQNLYLKSIINSLEDKELLHKKEKDVLETLAERDSMTGLYNRRKFEEALSQYSGRKNQNICMISADANFLKLTNDIFGHEAGDILLNSIAGIMKNLAKGEWLVARCGGDEFRVILPDTTLETALDYCRRIARDCAEDKSLTLPVSVALGAAEWDCAGESLKDCFARADAKMYQNKAALKHELHIPDYIMDRLYERQILSRNAVNYASQVTEEFCLHLGFSRDRSAQISKAAHYQDIGMAKLPESLIIRGQSKTDEETLQFHAHVTHGYTMARQFEELYMIADTILASHERWDGEGYPNGAKGYQIPLEARIIRITSSYAYRTVPGPTELYYPEADARQELTDNSGAVFDPELVSKFLKFLPSRKSV